MRLCSRRQTNGLACATLSLFCAFACDPKAGFESAVGSIDPDQKSYIDGPGSLLSAGPFDTVGIDFDVDTQVHLLARRRDDQHTSMTLFGQDAQNGCSIAPNVATWFSTKPATKPYRLLPFLDSRDAKGAGTLGFSSIDCEVEPYSLDNALGPIAPEVERGFLVQQAGGLVLADPWSATTQPLVSDLQRVFSLNTRFIVWGDAQLIVYDNDVNELMRYGNHVTAFIPIDGGSGAGFAAQDDDGLHSLFFDADSQTFTFNLVDGEACALSSYGGRYGWVAVHSPCSDDHLVAEGIDPTGVADVQQLPFTATADSLAAKIQGVPIPTTSALLAQVSAYYLEDVDASTGLGTLFAAQPASDPVRIGANAALERASSVAERTGWAGVALVDVQNGLGRLLRWNWDGTQQTLAENVDRAATAPGFLANFDGTAGDQLSLDIQANVTLEQSGAPPFDSTLHSDDFAWTLQLDRFDGSTGELTLAQAEASFEPVAQGVPPDEYQYTTIIPLPGFAYLAGYDEKALSGTLFANNLTLGSTMTVAHGVSDFVPTSYPLPGILYTVPAGSNAGLWFARAK